LDLADFTRLADARPRAGAYYDNSERRIQIIPATLLRRRKRHATPGGKKPARWCNAPALP